MPDDIAIQYEALWKRIQHQPAKEIVQMFKMILGTYETKQDPEFLRICSRAADAYLTAETE